MSFVKLSRTRAISLNFKFQPMAFTPDNNSLSSDFYHQIKTPIGF